MASVYFDPEDYIDEVTTNDLVKELTRRAGGGDKDAENGISAPGRIMDLIEDICIAFSKKDAVDFGIKMTALFPHHSELISNKIRG